MSTPTNALLQPPRVRRGWYIVARTREIGSRPVKRRLFGLPLVVFRDGRGKAGVLVDRCPHRNVPLSGGRVVQGDLQCPYHGWRFDAEGRCTALPALDGAPDRSHAAAALPVREQQGYVWAWGDPGCEPVGDPWRFVLAESSDYLVVHRSLEARGTVHAVAENALDVPHTAFLHGGLFRNDADRKPIRCVVERHPDRVECEYIGEPRPEGILGRILSPSGGLVTHFDRFHLPSVIEVEYRIGTENHILVNAALTPIDDFTTALHAVVALRTRLPGWLIRPFLTPIVLRVFRQDARVLAQQTETLQRFGETRFLSTELDLLGPHIFKLLQRAAQDGVPAPDPAREPSRREVTMWI
ncbi:MAG: aromatic ring-hydroxylating dioxygenase subunit alpha [Myxococcota bacterium]